MSNTLFDDLRPYRDEEIASAMQRITESDYFSQLSSFVFPNRDAEEIKQMMRGFTSIYEFQSQVMALFNEQVIARSMRHFSYDGLENLDKNKCYLFVSNHRDIVMDSSLLQYVLHICGYRTSEITFGSNLMSSPLIIDIGKSNKMFKVIRGGSIKDFYTNSLHLSDYIRYAITQKQESVWIAQRNGRTKNGIDATDQGIVKMFYMNLSNNPVKAIAQLNIVPVAISYQWESCDLLKALELYQSKFGKYVKKPNEDLNSILTGITGSKGDVHISVGTPLTENDLAPLAGLPNNKFNMQVASLIDKQIYKHYKLSCNNYIAHDIREQNRQYAQHYTEEEKQLFVQHYNKAMHADVEDKNIFGDILLGIYANPVDSALG
ncbi:glycerol acyltransferase [Bacteroidia bacterium]|nr:glycerol acyltransferase [Bacteroidia bacterium]